MKKNIFIIDDSALMRRVLSDIINSDNRFHTMDFAANGLEALDVMLKKAKDFDAILLDINMPKMNGIEFLVQLKKCGIKGNIIIVSTIAKKDVLETIRALELGAFDFITKPETYMEASKNVFSQRLLECLAHAVKSGPLELGDSKEICRTTGIENSVPWKREQVQLKQYKSKLVAIACSTGGPKALHSVIPRLPTNLDAPVLIVQHMPAGFTKSLADRLNEISEIEVSEACNGDILQKGRVYIAKGGRQLRVNQNDREQFYLSVTTEPAKHGLQPCADIMYESLLKTKFDQITCVVLTGMGGDGTAGILQLNKEKNVYVIAQNEETCVVYGMPKVIKDAGIVDEVVALEDISDAIIKNVGVR
jgi:two-component system chemotaxis response regulator CheB